ncbi:MAG: GIY-YIG nuclease family protein [Elusimicrobiota bacterium]|jgi:hypothetical protein|nr:GIY-YIG nuclease family protein [Elusimicrobiota bacterium]
MEENVNALSFEHEFDLKMFKQKMPIQEIECVYEIVSKKGYTYVGFTTNFYRRMKQHISGSNCDYIRTSIKKGLIDSFKVRIIKQSIFDKPPHHRHRLVSCNIYDETRRIIEHIQRHPSKVLNNNYYLAYP